jgi:hypothetical protein
MTDKASASDALMPSHLISIGFMSDKRCYLGLSREDAEKRYLQETGEEDLQGVTVSEIKIINGAFQAYDVWEAT